MPELKDSTNLTKCDLVVHLFPDMTDVVVNHGQGKNNTQYGYNRKRYGGIGHKFVGFETPDGLHNEQLIAPGLIDF